MQNKLFKKIFVILSSSVLVFGQFFSNVVFAQYSSSDDVCGVCGAPAPELQVYTDFVYEVLDKIETVVPRGEDLGRYTSPGYFQAGYYEIPDKNMNILSKMVKGIVDNLKQKFWAVTAVGTIGMMFGPEYLQSARDGFKILFKQEAFVTSYAMLLRVDTEIHDMILNLGLAGAMNQKISDVNRLQIQQVFQKYQDEKLIFKSYYIDDDTRYVDLLMFLWSINSDMKKFISKSGRLIAMRQFSDHANEFNIYDKGVKINYSGKGYKKVFVYIDYAYLEAMDQNYKCARLEGGFKCSEEMIDFYDSLGVIDNAKDESLERSWQTIKDAVTDLKNAFSTIGSFDSKDRFGNDLSDQQKDFLTKNDDLFRSLYGVRTTEILDGGLQGVYTKMRTAMVEEKLSGVDYLQREVIDENIQYLQDQKDQLSDMIRDTELMSQSLSLANARKSQVDFYKIAKKECLDGSQQDYLILWNWVNAVDPNYMKELDTCDKIRNAFVMATNQVSPNRENLLDALNISSNDEKLLMKNFVDNAFSDFFDSQVRDADMATVVGNRGIMVFFTNILDELAVTEAVIGSKDDDGLIKNLGEACEMQCQNKGGMCYY